MNSQDFYHLKFNIMTKEEIDTFEKLQAQLNGLYIEISSLSKKSQNDALNKFKLKFVNQILIDANELLGNQYKPFKDFSTFDESDIPSNSDVTMMLTQYLNCFEKLRADNIVLDSDYETDWYWKINGKQSNIRTTIPQKIKNR